MLPGLRVWSDASVRFYQMATCLHKNCSDQKSDLKTEPKGTWSIHILSLCGYAYWRGGCSSGLVVLAMFAF